MSVSKYAGRRTCGRDDDDARPPGGAAGVPNELAASAAINEQVKEILVLSEQLALVATNAVLRGKRSGAAALGFAVAAREARLFARLLEREMAELAVQIGGLVAALAQKVQRLRRMELLCLACDRARGTPSQGAVELVCARFGRERDSWRVQGEEQWRRLFRTAERLEKTCRMGQSVGRSAKVEAAHGGAQAGLVRDAEQIERLASAIRERVRALRASGVARPEFGHGGVSGAVAVPIFRSA